MKTHLLCYSTLSIILLLLLGLFIGEREYTTEVESANLKLQRISESRNVKINNLKKTLSDKDLEIE